MAALSYCAWRMVGARRIRWSFLAAGCVILMAGLALRSDRIATEVPLAVADWLPVFSFLTLAFALAGAGILLVFHIIPSPKPRHSPERRRLLLTARTVVFAAPVVAVGYGIFVQRDNFQLREIDLPIPGLHPDLHGLRLVQISDIHMSAFLSEREFARTIDMANETKAHLSLVTGDLITAHHDPLDVCIRQLKRLRTEAPGLGCLGNHEVYARVEKEATEGCASVGIEMLRQQSRILTFRGQPINFAGVDYQSMRGPYLRGAEQLIRPGMPNILLSHNPDVFPVAARMGYDAIISGHTHGGQITVEILNQNLSVARFFTPYVYGLYREGTSSVWVTRGIGTVGVPARLGAPPEVVLIRLCAI